MTKLCSVCGTENRDEAQFCRACGTAFAAQAARPGVDDAMAANVCAECGFHNKPGLRYCANCGMSLATAVADGSDAAAATSGGSPPPISYPSFAPVAPYPSAPYEADQPVPDIPDPAAEIALRQQEASDTGDAAPTFGEPARPSRAPIVIGIVVAVLVIGGALAWTYMRNSDPSPPAIGATTAPVAPTLPPAASAAAPVIVETAPASSPEPANTSVPAVEAAPSAPAVGSASALGAPPTAAQPLPQIGDPSAPQTTEADQKRIAAERRRDRLAREKADRDAKAATEQRDQSAASAQRAEQDAARRRAEETQRARSAAAPTAAPTTAAAAGPRGVRELCAGRGTIAEAVCQSRQCGLAEHANEPVCRQLREQDERRRNFQN